MNPMQDIRIEKLTFNIGVGQPGAEMDKAMKLLEKITASKPIRTKSKRRIPTWGVRPGLEIGCKVTLRRKKTELLKNLLAAIGNKLNQSQFNNNTFSFGIPEYLDISGVEYDATIGILGLEVAVTLERKGYRIKRRTIQRKKIPTKKRITKEEAIEFIRNKFGTKIEEG